MCDPIVVGYVDGREEPYCPACWLQAFPALGAPLKVLLDIPEPARDTFRIIDECARCQTKLDYEDILGLV